MLTEVGTMGSEGPPHNFALPLERFTIHPSPAATIAADVARRNPPMLEAGDDLQDAITLMETVREEHIPVVNSRYSRRPAQKSWAAEFRSMHTVRSCRHRCKNVKLAK